MLVYATVHFNQCILICIYIRSLEIVIKYYYYILPKISGTKTTDASIKINKYELYSNIEEEDNIRGIALYIHSNLKVKEIKFNTNIWCTL